MKHSATRHEGRNLTGKLSLLTFPPAGTRPPDAVVSWPSEYLGLSYPRKSRPPLLLWVDGPWVSAAVCQSFVPLHYCIFYQNGQCRSPLLLPFLWMPPCRSHHSCLQRKAQSQNHSETPVILNKIEIFEPFQIKKNFFRHTLLTSRQKSEISCGDTVASVDSLKVSL